MVTPLLPDPILLSESCSDFVLSLFLTSEIYNIETMVPNMTAAMFNQRDSWSPSGFEDK